MDHGIIVISREMILIHTFQSEFKGKNYNIYRFVDAENLNIYTGTNLEGDLTLGQTYECELTLKGNKLVVVSAE